MELVTLSRPELDRLAALQRYQNSRLTQADVARELGLSERQIRRLVRRLEAGGPASVGSRRRGRPSNRRLPAATIATALTLVRERYPDFGPTFAAEKLRAVHGLQLSTESLRKAMIVAGLWEPRRKRRAQLHPPRERRPARGELLQLDGSHHRWFEDRAPRCVLMTAVDDASSAIVAARFERGETSAAYFALLHAVLQDHGRPIAVYTDRHTALRITPDKTGQTQVARALAELDIELICAGTPQAKGRVERAFHTLQHRLLREMRLRDISDIDTANAFLPEFLAQYNERFAVAPRCEHDAFRSADSFDLDYILTPRLRRTLTKDLTFQVGAELYQITNAVLPARLRGTAIEIDFVGGMRVYRRGVRLTFTHLRTLARAPVMGRKALESHYDYRQPNPKKAHPPAADHPWRNRGRFPLTKPTPDTSTSRTADI
jgi:DNA-binding Lrp family transcriptional regulator